MLKLFSKYRSCVRKGESCLGQHNINLAAHVLRVSEKETTPALLGLEACVSRKAVCNTTKQLPDVVLTLRNSFSLPHTMLGLQFRSPVPLSTLPAFLGFPLKPPEKC